MELCTFMPPPKMLKTVDFGYIWVLMGMSEPLGIWYEGLYQILTLGYALEPQLWSFLCLMLVLILLILDILKYMKVYGGYLRYMQVI